MKVPIAPPIIIPKIISANESTLGLFNVVIMAIVIPIIPIMFPFLADSGLDKPFSANMKKIAEIR